MTTPPTPAASEPLDPTGISLVLRAATTAVQHQQWGEVVRLLAPVLAGLTRDDRGNAACLLALAYVRTGSWDQARPLLHSVEHTAHLTHQHFARTALGELTHHDSAAGPQASDLDAVLAAALDALTLRYDYTEARTKYQRVYDDRWATALQRSTAALGLARIDAYHGEHSAARAHMAEVYLHGDARAKEAADHLGFWLTNQERAQHGRADGIQADEGQMMLQAGIGNLNAGVLDQALSYFLAIGQSGQVGAEDRVTALWLAGTAYERQGHLDRAFDMYRSAAEQGVHALFPHLEHIAQWPAIADAADAAAGIERERMAEAIVAQWTAQHPHHP